MVDAVQIVLLLVIVVLTVLLVVLGIQVFYILREFRKTIKKTNNVLDNADSITQSIQDPLSAISSITGGLGGGSVLTLARLVKTLLGGSGDTDRKQRD